MRNQKGFTLIELIIVIVVLGILAVTAAPQFIDFSSDARASTVQGAKGSINGAMDTVYARSSVDGTTKSASGSTVTTNAGTVAIVYGYPAATLDGIGTAAGLDNDQEWTSVVGTADADSPAEGSIAFFPASLELSDVDFTSGNDSCHVLYTEAESETDAASVTYNADDC
jgi:MSHA pilin protein MshA